MMKALLLSLYVLSATTTSNCSDGCLKCDGSACRLCDFTLGYTVSGSACSKITLDNCVTMNQRGACLTCAKNYYLDSSTSKCVAVAAADVVLNCSAYGSATACSTCATGFYLANGACVSVGTAIANCDTQSGADKCLVCSAGFYLSLDSSSCSAGATNDNCASYTNIECSSCTSGYIKNSNYYLYQLSNLSSPGFESDATNFILKNVNTDINGKDIDVCQSVQVSNCDSFETFNSCSVCASGFYLDNRKQCVAYPFTTIINCEVYSDLTTCAVCKHGYFMEAANSCVQVPAVDNCAVYTNIDNGKNCELCVDGYYLLSINSCVPRKRPTIDNCVTLVANAEACDQCNIGFRATDDGSKCMSVIPHCAVYEPSNALVSALACYKCEAGYYYDVASMTCAAGTIDKCDIYEKTSNVCSICANKFYLSANNCLPHSTLLNCDVYHPTLKNICINCSADTFLFEKENQCVSVVNVPNCASYTDISTCGMCKDGYFLTSNTCVQIPVSENCLQRRGALCGKCINDFILENGVCKDSLDYIVNECSNDNVDGTVNYKNSKCFTCKTNTYPLSYKNAYVCVESSYMTLLRNNAAAVANCTHYSPIDNGYECARCASGYYLDNGACVTSCTNAARATLYKQILKVGNTDGDKLDESFYVYRINVCWTTITGCAVAAPNTIQTNVELIDYQCIQCNAGLIPRVNFSADSTLVANSSDPMNQFNNSPVTRVPGLRCFNPTVTTNRMVGDISPATKTLANCDYYKNWGPITGCTKCSFGYSGVVLDVVTQCAVYTNDAYNCKQCKQGYYLASAYECKQVTQIDSCTTYSTTADKSVCTQCVPAKYLNAAGTACTQRVNSLNVLNSTVSVAADNVTCTAGYFKDVGSSPYKCVQMNPNCTTGTVSGSAFTCSACNTAVSYFDNATKTCLLGTKSNCATYLVGAVNTCDTCAANYYKSSSNCVAHVRTDTNCGTWSLTAKNTCTTCNGRAVKFAVQNKCTTIPTLITGCIQYDSKNTCILCSDGLRLNNLKTRCLAIPDSENCAVSTVISIDGNSTIDVTDGVVAATPNPVTASISKPAIGAFYYTCDKCKPNFTRHVKGQIKSNSNVSIDMYGCFSELSYKLGQCNANNITGVEDFSGVSCSKCNSGFYPRNWNSKYTCLESSYFSVVNSPAVSNCERVIFDTATSKYLCTRCVYPYLLQANGSCAATCGSASTYGVFSAFKSTVIGSTSNYATSLESSDSSCMSIGASYLVANCAVYSKSIDYAAFVCVKCNAGFIPILDYSSSLAFIDGYTSVTGRPVSPISAHPSIYSCDTAIVSPDVNIMKGDYSVGTNLINNCKYYKHFEDYTVSSTNYHVYGCVRCNYGYTGQVLDYVHTTSGDKYGYIKNCVAPTLTQACDVTTTYNDNAIGLGTSLAHSTANRGLTKFFSCLKCATADYIPFLFVTADATNAYDVGMLNGYIAATPFTTGTVTAANAGRATECINAYSGSSAQVQTILGTSGNNFPVNCALGVVNINGSNDNGDGLGAGVVKLAAYCVACASGYKPTFFGTNASPIYQAISACTAITTCTGSTGWFNSCSSCTYHFDIYKNVVDYTTCIATPPANCFAAYEVGPCVLCKKGYDKDKDGVCVQETVPSCATPNLNRNYEYYFHGKLLTIEGTSAYFYGESDEVGCRSCNAGSVLTKFNLNGAGTALADANLSSYICNDFKTEPSLITSFYDATCKMYGMVGSDVKCKECNATYTLTTDYQCKNVTIPNCSLIKATDGFTCVTCDDTYLNVGGFCLLKTGLHGGHCTTFADSSISTFAVCSVCADGYVKSADGSQCAAINSTTYPNCVALDASNVCTKCALNYVLATNASGKFCYPLVNFAGAKFDSNCKSVSASDFNNGTLTCTECTSTSVLEAGNTDVPTWCGDFKNADLFTNDQCTQYDITASPLSSNTFACTGCKDLNTHYYKLATKQCVARANTSQCSAFDDNKDLCTACNNNYALSPDGTTCTAIPTDVAGGYIQRCMSMGACSSKVVYAGLAPQLSSIFSCHQCSTALYIPVAVVRAGASYGAIQGLQEFSFGITAGTTYGDNAGDSSVTCVNPSNTAFSMTALNYAFPDNCGAAILNANSIANSTSSRSATNVDRTKVAAMCVACKPKFAPAGATDTSGAVVPFMVSSCTTIPRCESSLWFSACSQCNPNNSYGYAPSTGVRYDQCVLYTANPNCYAVDNTDPDNLKCKYCRKGYYLNRDGICELVHPPRCAYSKFRFQQYYQGFDLPNGLSLSSDGIGCQQCDDGFVGLFNAADDRQVCTQSPYLTAGVLPDESNFIKNCANYEVSNGNVQKCDTCAANYVLTVEGKCVPIAGVNHCAIAYNESSCFECVAPFVLVNRQCVAGTITSCLSYANNEVYAAQVCELCADGFYLQDNACLPGAITNCQSYDDATTCNNCVAGYGLVKSKNSIDYCYPIDASLNCATLDYDNLKNGVLQCTSCLSSGFIASNNENLFNKTICMAFIPIANCASYDTAPNIQDSSFGCLRCTDQYYLQNGACVARTVQPAQCVQYSLTEDICTQCAPQFFLTVAGDNCNAFPDGIAGCVNYLSKSTCFGCDTNMYLKNNACVPVESSDRLAHCLTYDDPQTCATCSAGYIVVDGKCASIVAANCLTYENTNACDSCPAGYGLKLQAGVLNCVQNNIANCSVGTEVEPFECLVCANNYYVNAGACTAVTTPIVNCVQYDGAAVCAVCASGSVLSTDKLSCLKTTEIVSVLDSNCHEAKLTADLLCNSCKPGYVFVNGVCSSCSKQSLSSGCYVCDPTNDGMCLMCAPGYYQFTDGTCVKNGLQPGEVPTTTDPVTESSVIVKVLTAAVLMLLFR